MKASQVDGRGGVAVGCPGVVRGLARVLAGALGVAAAITGGTFAAVPAGASAAIVLDGSFSAVVVKPEFAGLCPSGVADECGTMQLAGLGAADWAYRFGPASPPMAAASMWTARSRSRCSQTGARSPAR